MSPTRIFTKSFIAGTVVNLLLYVNYYVLIVVMTNYCAETFATDLSTAGFASSIFIVGALVARFVSPIVIGAFGRKRTLVIGIAMMAVLSACYLVNAGMAALFAVRLLHGFFYGLAQTTVTSITTEGVPDAHKGEGIGYYMLSVTVGSAIGPFLGTTLMHGTGFGVLFILCTAVALGGLSCEALVHDPRSAKRSKNGGEGEAASTAEKTADSAAAERSAAEHPAPAPRRRISLSTFLEASAVPISVVLVLVYFGYGSVITYLNAYAAEAGLTEAASLFFVAYALTMLVSRPFTGKAFDRYGDLGVMASGFVAFLAAMLLLGFVSNGVMLLAAACFMGYGIGTLQPSGLTLAVRRAPDSRFDVANSTFFVFLDAAIGLCPILLGWTIPVIGYRGLFLALSGVTIAAFALYLTLRKASKIG